MNKTDINRSGEYIFHGQPVKNGERLLFKEGDIVIDVYYFGGYTLRWLEFVPKKEE